MIVGMPYLIYHVFTMAHENLVEGTARVPNYRFSFSSFLQVTIFDQDPPKRGSHPRCPASYVICPRKTRQHLMRFDPQDEQQLQLTGTIGKVVILFPVNQL